MRMPGDDRPTMNHMTRPDDRKDALPENAISVRALTKVYKGSRQTPPKEALKAVDLDIPRGSLFGLLGPNGAGKSTFINILAGLVNKTSGSAAIWDHDIDREARAARSAIGIVPQELNLDAFFTPRELLELQAGLYAVPKGERRTMEILQTVGLADKAESYARSLSGGMRRRLMVAKAMVHRPPVLVLDEPTAGVDVELRQQLWSHIRALNHAGTTIVLTTHYLEEAEQLCDRIAIIHHGSVIAADATWDLIARVDRKELSIITTEALSALPDALGRFDATLQGARNIVVRYKPSQTRMRDILDAVRGSGITIADLTTHESDLEDLFLELTSDTGEGGEGGEAGEAGPATPK
jgi:ABC-2 type transport system ATP-binding protein